jgi:hypothetical protein
LIDLRDLASLALVRHAQDDLGKHTSKVDELEQPFHICPFALKRASRNRS